MASIKQLNDKIKTFQDFKKVVNIQKIVVMKEISRLKKVIDQALFRSLLFENYLIDINKEFKIYNNILFDTKYTTIPIKRNLYFIMQSHSSRILQYLNKIILEYIQKHHKPSDLYVVIGNELSDTLTKNGINVINTIDPSKVSKESNIFTRIAFQVLRGSNDLLFCEAFLLFASSLTKKIEEHKIFPFNNKKTELSQEEKNRLGSTQNLFSKTNYKKIIWHKSFSSVIDKLALFSVEMKAYSVVVQYHLSSKTQELASLDDKEKNIDSEIELISLLAQRIRKENVTNELLTNATAFSALSAAEEEEAV